MTTAVTGVYPDLPAAEHGIAALEQAGFQRDSVSVILRATPDHERLVLEETDDTPRGVLAGILGGGAFASLAFGVLALPGIGVLAAGPLLAMLTAGSAGAAVGGIVGAMVGHGLSTQLAMEYENAIRRGAVVVAVHTVHARAREARGALSASGATNVSDNVHFTHRSESEAHQE